MNKHRSLIAILSIVSSAFSATCLGDELGASFSFVSGDPFSNAPLRADELTRVLRGNQQDLNAGMTSLLPQQPLCLYPTPPSVPNLGASPESAAPQRTPAPNAGSAPAEIRPGLRVGSAEDVNSFLARKNFPGENENSCKGIPRNVRALFFEHLREDLDSGKKITEREIRSYSTRMGRIMAVYEYTDRKGIRHYAGESDGDTTQVTEHKNEDNHNGYLKTQALSNLDRYRNAVFTKKVPNNAGTDYGLLQQSYSELTQTSKSPWQAVTTRIVNATNAIVRTISFGSIKPKDKPLVDPDSVGARTLAHFYEYQKIAQADSSKAVVACGSNYMFKEGKTSAGQKQIAAEFDKIKGCQVCKNNHCSTSPSPSEMECWARWNTLCPNLNIAIAMEATEGYYGSKRMDAFVYDSDGVYKGKKAGKNDQKVGRCYSTMMSMLNEDLASKAARNAKPLTASLDSSVAANVE